MDSSIDRVVPLDELDDFRVSEGDPDVRGWDVLSADGRKVGEVDNLLIDTAAMKVRYLDVDIDDDLLTDGVDRHVLIPIGFARLDEDSDQVFVDGLNSAGIQQLPEYRRGSLTQDYETTLRGHFSDVGSTGGISTTRASTSGTSGRDIRTGDVESDNRFFATQRDVDEESLGDRTDFGRVDIHEQNQIGIREDGRERF